MGLYQLTDNERLDNVGIDVVQLNGELARLCKDAGLHALGNLVPTWRSRATVTEDTFRVLTSTAILTRRHSSNEAKGCNLAAAWLISVLMSTLHAIRAFLSQKVNVTQLESLDTVDFDLVVVFARWVDALSSSVARNDLVTVNRLICW